MILATDSAQYMPIWSANYIASVIESSLPRSVREDPEIYCLGNGWEGWPQIEMCLGLWHQFDSIKESEASWDVDLTVDSRREKSI
jgi:hypothetical protein